MSAAELREAAQLMRERAQAATPGPWAVSECEAGDLGARRTLGTYSLVHTGRAQFPNSAREVAILRGFADEREPDAAHIAGMDPAVALAVADWLDYTAAAEEKWASRQSSIEAHVAGYVPALAVARAFLSPSPAVSP